MAIVNFIVKYSLCFLMKSHIYMINRKIIHLFNIFIYLLTVQYAITLHCIGDGKTCVRLMHKKTVI